MRDVILVIRADEAHHRVVNHTLSSLPLCAPNPFLPGEKSCKRLRMRNEAQTAQTGENEDTRPRTQDIFRGLSNV